MIQYTIILYRSRDVKSFTPEKYSIWAKSAFCTFSQGFRLEFSIITIRTIFRNFFMNFKLNMGKSVSLYAFDTLLTSPYQKRIKPL